MPTKSQHGYTSKAKYLIYSLFFGTLCLFLDSCFPDAVITPLLSLFFLFLVARTKDWETVSVCLFVLILFVFVSLSDQDISTILIRCMAFLLSGSMAIAFSRARQRYTDALASAQAILRSTPAPMVAANITGAIVAASDETTAMLPTDFIPIVGHSFSDVFLGHLPPGRAMKTYIDWFQMEGTRNEYLYLREQADKPIRARILTTGDGRDRLLVAAIQSTT